MSLGDQLDFVDEDIIVIDEINLSACEEGDMEGVMDLFRNPGNVEMDESEGAIAGGAGDKTGAEYSFFGFEGHANSNIPDEHASGRKKSKVSVNNSEGSQTSKRAAKEQRPPKERTDGKRKKMKYTEYIEDPKRRRDHQSDSIVSILNQLHNLHVTTGIEFHVTLQSFVKFPSKRCNVIQATSKNFQHENAECSEDMKKRYNRTHLVPIAYDWSVLGAEVDSGSREDPENSLSKLGGHVNVSGPNEYVPPSKKCKVDSSKHPDEILEAGSARRSKEKQKSVQRLDFTDSSSVSQVQQCSVDRLLSGTESGPTPRILAPRVSENSADESEELTRELEAERVHADYTEASAIPSLRKAINDFKSKSIVSVLNMLYKLEVFCKVKFSLQLEIEDTNPQHKTRKVVRHIKAATAGFNVKSPSDPPSVLRRANLNSEIKAEVWEEIREVLETDNKEDDDDPVEPSLYAQSTDNVPDNLPTSGMAGNSSQESHVDCVECCNLLTSQEDHVSASGSCAVKLGKFETQEVAGQRRVQDSGTREVRRSGKPIRDFESMTVVSVINTLHELEVDYGVKFFLQLEVKHRNLRNRTRKLVRCILAGTSGFNPKPPKDTAEVYRPPDMYENVGAKIWEDIEEDIGL